MKKLIILPGLLLFLSPVYAQTDVTAGVNQGKDFGVTYSLPKTEIDLIVKVNKVTYTPGEFSKYADRYLRLNNVGAEPEVFWELVSVEGKPVGVPDSDKTYFIKLKDKTVAPLVELTDDGIIQSINMPLTGKQVPAAKVVPAQKKRVDPRSFLTEEILMANSTAKMAELVAKEIYNIRESKNALVRGQADNTPKDGVQLKLMLDNLDEQEQAMTEMFSGHRDKEEKIYTIRLVPTKEMDKEIAFRFSKKLGVVSSNNLAGEPVYVSLRDNKSLNIPPEEGKKKAGVVYNVPGTALLTVTAGKEKLFETEIPVTQFGTTGVLLPDLFNKKSTAKVVFNPTTGGIVKVDRDEDK